MAIPYERPQPSALTRSRPDIITEHSAGQGQAAGSVAPIDWSSLLGQAGLPPNIINEVSRIFSRTPDVQQAIALGQAYIRSTPWYAQTYPGIQSGIKTGLISNEADYRAYQNQLDQLYRQYHNRSANPLEVAQHLTAGQSAEQVAKQFGGQAYVQANAPQIQQVAGAFGDTGPLTDKQLTALGNEQAGIDTAMGQKVTAAFARAQKRMEGAFKGVLASPALSLASGRPAGSAAGQQSDVAA